MSCNNESSIKGAVPKNSNLIDCNTKTLYCLGKFHIGSGTEPLLVLGHRSHSMWFARAAHQQEGSCLRYQIPYTLWPQIDVEYQHACLRRILRKLILKALKGNVQAHSSELSRKYNIKTHGSLGILVMMIY